MKLRIHVLIPVLVIGMLLTAGQALAFPAVKVGIMPVIHTAASNDREVNELITTKIKSSLKFPHYEAVFLPDNPTPWSATAKKADKPVREIMAKVAAEKGFDLVIAVEIARMEQRLISSAFGDDLFEESAIRLVGHIYQANGSQYQTVKASRGRTVPASVDSGVLPDTAEAMDEILAKINAKIAPKPANK